MILNDTWAQKCKDYGEAFKDNIHFTRRAYNHAVEVYDILAAYAHDVLSPNVRKLIADSVADLIDKPPTKRTVNDDVV